MWSEIFRMLFFIYQWFFFSSYCQFSKGFRFLFFTFATSTLLMLRVIELIMCIKVVRCNSWVMIAPFQICHQLKYTLYTHILYLARHKAFNNNNAIKIQRYDQFEIMYSCLWNIEYSIMKLKLGTKWKIWWIRRRSWRGKKKKIDDKI